MQVDKFLKRNFFALLSLFILFLGVHFVLQDKRIVFAQTVTPTIGVTSAKPKVVYPVTIPKVGTCESWASCRRLCADPVYTTSCRAWAEEQKLVKPKVDPVKVLDVAKTTLGCGTKEECVAFCKVEANQDKCDEFAKKQGLGGGFDKHATNVVAQIANGTIDPAKKILIQSELTQLASGAATLTPKDLVDRCNLEQNKGICMALAQKLGIVGGQVVREGPGGCMSVESCTDYCKDESNAVACGRPVKPAAERSVESSRAGNGAFDKPLRPAPKNTMPTRVENTDQALGGEVMPKVPTRLPTRPPLPVVTKTPVVATPKLENGTQLPRLRTDSGGIMSTGTVPTSTPIEPGTGLYLNSEGMYQQVTNNTIIITATPKPTPSPTPSTTKVLGASTEVPPQKLPRVDSPWNDFLRRIFWK